MDERVVFVRFFGGGGGGGESIMIKDEFNEVYGIWWGRSEGWVTVIGGA